MAGDDPWVTGNAYGPAYNLIAVAYSLHTLLPKLIFAFAWIAGSWHLVRELARLYIGVPWQIFWLVALPLNPLFWVQVLGYGSVDGLIASICLLAIASHQSSRYSIAGSVLALAVLLKFYPIVIVPFLDGYRIN